MTDEPASPIAFGLLDDVLGFRMQRLRSVLAASMLAAMKRWGLRQGAFMVLALVQDNPGLSQTAIARETGIDKAQLVALLHQLEADGLVVRRPSAADRRHNQLFVTDPGRDVIADMAEVVARIEAPIHRALSPAALDHLKEALDQALAAVRAAGPDA